MSTVRDSVADFRNGSPPPPRYTESAEAARPPQPRSSSSFMLCFPLFFAVLVSGGLVVLVLYLFGDMESSVDSDNLGLFGQNGSRDDDGKRSTGNESRDSLEELIKGLPEECPIVAPGDRLLLFWQSEIGGVTKVPDGVTHVVFGFSEVKDSVASLKLQGNAATLKRNIRTLHKKCIRSMISIGGANNLAGMAAITEPEVFAASLVALAEEYDVDGIEIDDENVGDNFDADLVLAYMTAARQALKENGEKVYDFTWDGLVLSLPGNCGVGDHSRCYPPALTPLVDWVNVLAYNVFNVEVAAAAFYEAAIEETFQAWLEVLDGVKEKLALATCVPDDGNGGGSCTYGVGASEAVVTEWTTFGNSHGGMFLYAGSADKRVDYQLTNTIINAQK